MFAAAQGLFRGRDHTLQIAQRRDAESIGI